MTGDETDDRADQTYDEQLRGRILRGELEADRLPPEMSRHHPVCGYGYSPVNEWGDLYDPVLDHARLSEGEPKPEWPDDASFAVCLTHDLDHVAARSPRHAFRKGLLRARERWRARNRDGPGVARAGAIGSLAGLAGGLLRATRNTLHSRPDPIQQFERWLSAEAEVGASSTFFVPPNTTSEPHVSDPVYRYDDAVTFDGKTMTVGAMLRELVDRGVEIGLHPTWYAYDDSKELRRQRRRLETEVGTDVVSVRQHWLHHDIRRTPAAHDEAGFQYDSTLAVTGNVGFRFGTAWPWHLYNRRDDEDLDILELPLLAQDTALFDGKHMGLDEEQAFRYVRMLVDAVERVGGVLTLNWHPNLSYPAERWRLYERTLAHLADRNAWFGTVREVGEWWNDNR